MRGGREWRDQRRKRAVIFLNEGQDNAQAPGIFEAGVLSLSLGFPCLVCLVSPAQYRFSFTISPWGGGNGLGFTVRVRLGKQPDMTGTRKTPANRKREINRDGNTSTSNRRIGGRAKRQPKSDLHGI